MKRSGSSAFRMAAFALLLLGLGAATSVAVAWANAVLFQHFQAQDSTEARTQSERWPGVHVDVAYAIEGEGTCVWDRAMLFRPWGIDGDEPQWAPPAWSRLSRPPDEGDSVVYELATGWPCKCVMYVYEPSAGERWLVTKLPEGAISGLWPEQMVPGTGRRVSLLPIDVITWNLTLDAAFWSIVILGLLRVPAAYRCALWWRRGRQARCGSCGYILTSASGERCSECGATMHDSPRIIAMPSLTPVVTALVVVTVLGTSFLVSFRAMGGEFALHWAANEGNADAVRRILDRGVDPDTVYEGSHGETPLMVACSKGRLEVAEYLIEAGADVNATDQNARLTPLHRAAAVGCREVVVLLCQHGANVEALTVIGEPPIHFAIGSGSVGTVEVLLDQGARIDVVNKLGRGAMHAAAGCNSIDIVKLLWERGAPCDQRDQGGSSPLWEALRQGHIDTAEFLFAHGARIDDLESYGANLWHLADQVLKSEELTTALLKSDLDINQRDEGGMTALMRVAMWGSSEAVEFLLQNGADALAEDEYGQTVLEFASAENRQLIRAAIEQQRSEVSEMSGDDD